MDLSNLDLTVLADKGFQVQLLHPGFLTPLENDKGEPMIITVIGSDSTTWEAEIDAITAKNLMDSKRKGALAAQKAAIEAVKDLKKRGVELMAKSTVGWSNLQLDGKDFPFSYNNAITLYTKHKWVKEQIDAEVGNRENLFKS